MSNITNKPVKATKVDVDAFKFSKVNTLPSGAKTIYLNHGDGIAPLFVQTPEMTVPFDSGTYYPDNEQSGKYAVKVSMDNIDTNENMKQFHDMLNNMDERLIKFGVDNSSEWFKSQQWFKKKGEVAEKVADNYTRMVKVSLDPETQEPNGKWAPSFGFKVVKRDGKVLCDCYDSDKNELVTSGEGAVDLETMFKKGTKVKMIIKCNGLWMSTAGWGCTWRAEQIKIDVPTGFSGYAFDDSDDEDGGVELTRQASVVNHGSPVNHGTSDTEVAQEEVAQEEATNYVDDSSDSDDGEDDGEEEVKVVKRKVKKGN